MKQIEVDYEIGQKVKIELNQMVGTVKIIWVEKGQTKYNVEWAIDDSKIHDKWFNADEVRAIDKESDLFLGEYEDDKKTEVKED